MGVYVSSSLKIVWALDPYADVKKTWKRAAQVVRALQRSRRCSVQPVYVLGAEGLNWVSPLNATEADRFVPQVQKKMSAVLERLGLRDAVLPPRVIVSRHYSVRQDVAELVRFADRWSADLVVINTHARTGMRGMVLGSFAETLLFRAKFPVLFVSPHTREIKSLKRVLMPTDFSPGSRRVLKDLAGVLRRTAATVTLYNRIPYPIQAFADAGVTLAGGGWLSVDEFVASDQRAREKLAAPFGKMIRAEGIKCEVLVAEGESRISDDIMRVAGRQKADVIAMGSEVGPLSQWLIGSMARNVIRESDLPVLVQHYPR
jgi:nucleotide-binding universal stress UspA family protein